MLLQICYDTKYSQEKKVKTGILPLRERYTKKNSNGGKLLASQKAWTWVQKWSLF